jgi:hypothetical protein
VKPFARTKRLLRKRAAAYTDKGEKGMKDIATTAAELSDLNDNLVREFPWDEALTMQHLEACGQALRGLLYTEQQAAALLGKAL